MTNRTPSSPTICSLYLLLGLLVLALRPQGATADCFAKDFDQVKMLPAIGELGDSTANLKALQSSPSVTSTVGGLLALATQVTDRAAAESALFFGYLQIYSDLKSQEDRAATDIVIRNMAQTQYQGLNSYADYLTVLADNLPKYAGEIRQARDRVRRVATMFQCASTGSGQ